MTNSMTLFIKTTLIHIAGDVTITKACGLDRRIIFHDPITSSILCVLLQIDADIMFNCYQLKVAGSVH